MMKVGIGPDPLADEDVQTAIRELQGLISERYPDASFAVWVGLGEDTDGIYIEAAVDDDDLTDVADLYIDRLVDLQVEEGLPIRVIPVRPEDRFAAMFGARPSPMVTR